MDPDNLAAIGHNGPSDIFYANGPGLDSPWTSVR